MNPKEKALDKMSSSEQESLRKRKLKELQAEGRAMYGSHNTTKAKFKRLLLSK